MKKEPIVEDVELESVFKNEEKGYIGFRLNWSANIGFGEMTFLKQDNKLLIETECMSDNNDKKFIHKVLDRFIEKLEVIE